MISPKIIQKYEHSLNYYLKKLKVYCSLVNSMFIVLINSLYGWGSIESCNIFITSFILYNITDLVFNIILYNGKIQNDVLLHHISFISAGLAYKWYSSDPIFMENAPYIIKWLIMGEISTIFNNIRILYSKTKYRVPTSIAFALCFWIVRGYSTIFGFIDLMSMSHYRYISLAIMSIYAYLNISWGYLIFQKFYFEYNHSSLKKN
jgi:hypothetical protein